MTAVLATAATALLIALVGTGLLIRWFTARGIGQPIHDAVAQHASKAGTPSMDGRVIVYSAPVAYGVGLAVLGQAPTRAGLILVATVMPGGAVGALDDWMKLSGGSHSSGWKSTPLAGW